MCGIVGVHYLRSDKAVTPDQLKAMNDRIVHRGPDDSGEMTFGSTGIGMRRLSIIDLSSGHQPMANEDGSVWVVFNGEIYNYPELKERLAKAGHRFQTTSDTEVLVHGYEEWGDAFVEELNGMFGFAIWDKNRRRLVLGRDRVGIKPLFYYLDDRLLAFASEIKALLAHPEVPRDVDGGALDEFMTLEYVLAPRTLLKGVKKLRPGHLLIVEDGKARETRYWRPKGDARFTSEAEAAEAVRRELRDAVKRHMLADVPLGAFLSGGIDSSVIVGLMSELDKKPVQTFSIGFEDASYNESSYARLVAKRFGTDHHELILKPDAARFFDDFVSYLDEPIGDVSIIPTFLVSRMARERVKVALSGDGGDELFGGYDAYLANGMIDVFARYGGWSRGPLGALADALPPAAKKKGLVNRFKRFMEGTSFPADVRQYRFMSFLRDDEREALYTPEFRRSLAPGNAFAALKEQFAEARGMGDPLNQMMYADIRVYLPEDILPKVDVASMATSLESRVPFLDNRVVELAMSIPGSMKIKNGRRKHILKEAFKDLLPEEIVNRGKEGFSIPVKNWLKAEWRDALEDTLHPDTLRRLGYFNPAAVRRLIDEHASGRQNHAHKLWCLMVFHLWHQKFISTNADAQPARVLAGGR